MIRVFSQYISPKAICLMLWETFLILFCLGLAAKVRFWSDPYEFSSYMLLPEFAIQAFVILVIYQVCFYYNELYDLHVVRRRSEQIWRLAEALGAGCILLGF